MSSAKQLTTTSGDFEPSLLTFTQFEENDRSKGQLLAYPRYGDTKAPLMLQLPWIKIYSGGVPRLGEYYQDDKARAFIKIPLDLLDPEVKKLHDKLRKVDELMVQRKGDLFGKKGDKYKYISICRDPIERDDDDDKKPSGPQPIYIKIKLDTTYPEGDVKTLVYNSVEKNGKRERTLQKITTVTEFAEIVRYQSRIRAIIRPVKAWAEKKTKTGSDKMLYGITFKLIKVEVEPAEHGFTELSSYMVNDAFIDSDDDEPAIVSKGKSNPVITTDNSDEDEPIVKSKVVVESSDEDEPVIKSRIVAKIESSSEEELEPEPEPLKKTKVEKAKPKGRK